VDVEWVLYQTAATLVNTHQCLPQQKVSLRGDIPNLRERRGQQREAEAISDRPGKPVTTAGHIVLPHPVCSS